MHLLLALILTTTTFRDGHTVPLSMVATRCGGGNVSPNLAWTGVPAATKSFALIVHDPDAPHPGGFYHWVLYDIPADTREIGAAAPPEAAQSGRNGTGSTGYFGPCPPPGKLHHYHVTLYALDTDMHSSEPLDATQLQARMRGHVLAQAELVGLFQL